MDDQEGEVERLDFEEYIMDDAWQAEEDNTHPRKRDTKIKHEDNHSGEEIPKFNNLKEIILFSKLDDNEVEEIRSDILEWVQKNLSQKINFNSHDARESVEPLIDLLHGKYENNFATMSTASARHVIYALIKRIKYNRTRNVSSAPSTLSKEKERVQEPTGWGSGLRAMEHKERQSPETPSHSSMLQQPRDSGTASLSSKALPVPDDYMIVAGDSMIMVRFVIQETDAGNLAEATYFETWKRMVIEDLEVPDIQKIYFEGAMGPRVVSNERQFISFVTWAFQKGHEQAHFLLQDPTGSPSELEGGMGRRSLLQGPTENPAGLKSTIGRSRSRSIVSRLSIRTREGVPVSQSNRHRSPNPSVRSSAVGYECADARSWLCNPAEAADGLKGPKKRVRSLSTSSIESSEPPRKVPHQEEDRLQRCSSSPWPVRSPNKRKHIAPREDLEIEEERRDNPLKKSSNSAGLDPDTKTQDAPFSKSSNSETVTALPGIRDTAPPKQSSDGNVNPQSKSQSITSPQQDDHLDPNAKQDNREDVDPNAKQDNCEGVDPNAKQDNCDDTDLNVELQGGVGPKQSIRGEMGPETEEQDRTLANSSNRVRGDSKKEPVVIEIDDEDDSDGIVFATISHLEQQAAEDEDQNLAPDDAQTGQPQHTPIMERITPGLTDHLSEEQWENCARLFLHDPSKKDPSFKIQLPGMKNGLYPYQVYGVYLMLMKESVQGGGYLADGMGLGKTVQALALIVISRLILLNQKEVTAFRRSGVGDRKHLFPGSKEKLQPDDAQCPSGNPYGIECPCVDASPASHIRTLGRANLIVLPAALLAQWLDEFKNHIDVETNPNEWVLACGHGDPKNYKKAKQLRLSDYKYLDPAANAAASSNFVCFTTRESYKNQVQKCMVETVGAGARRRRTEKELYWGRIICDEAHKDISSTSRGPAIFDAHPQATKWFLTGTPFEKGPGQMGCWVNTMELNTWLSTNIPKRSLSFWPKIRESRDAAKYCSKTALAALNKDYEKIVAGTITASKTIENHLGVLQAVLRMLWIQRKAERSTFFGYPLVKLPPTEHTDVKLRLSDAKAEVIKINTGHVNDIVRESHRRRLEEWKAKGSLGPEPQVAYQRWLEKVRKIRVISTFPMLLDLEDTRGLKFTGSQDCAEGWVKRKRGCLYTMERTNNPYRRNLRAITAMKDCPKIRAIHRLITNEFQEGERVVFVTMGPTNAYILYLYLREIIGAKVALITSQIPKSEASNICLLFCGDPELLEKHSEEGRPQYLVSTTSLIGIGYNLTGATRLVQVDPEWYEREQIQARHRIHRIGQLNKTWTYSLKTQNSEIEQMLWDRQHRRAVWLKMSMETGVDSLTQAENPEDCVINDPDGEGGEYA